MRTSALMLLSLLTAGLTGSAAPIPKDADIGKECLVNGGFEDGPEVELFLALDADDKRVKGWTVTRGQIDYIGKHWEHAEGKRSLDLHGSPGYGGVKQSFKTAKGATYKVTFQLAGNPNTTIRKKGVWVEAAGEKQKFTADSTDATELKMKWTKQEWQFVATGEETTLEIRTADTTDQFAGPALDDVSVKRTK